MIESVFAPESPQDLYDHAPCGFFSCTMDGVVVNVNETLLGWLGCERGLVLGASFEDWLPPGDRLFYETRFILAVRLRGEVREVGLSLNCADGSRLPVLLNARVQPGPSGEPRIRVAVFDVPQRIDYERSLLAAQRAAEASEERVRVLQQASAAFAGEPTVTSLVARLAEFGRSASSAAMSAVLLRDSEEQLVLTAGTHPLALVLPHAGPTPEEDAARCGKTVVVSSLDEADSIYPGLSAPMRAARLAALTATPILDDQRVLGVLMCFFRRDRDFDEPMLELQRALTRQAAQVMLRMRLEDDRRCDRQKAKRLRRMGREVSAGLRATNSPRMMAQLVAREVGEALGVDAVRIAVLAEGDIPRLDVLWPQDSMQDDSPDSDRELRVIVRSLWSEHVSSSARESAEPDSRATVKARRYLGSGGAEPDSAIIAPLGERELAIGIIAVSTQDPFRLLTPSERSIVQSIAAELTHNLLQASLLLAQTAAVQRLIQLDQEKVDLIANVDHELRTPLTSIIGYADLIAERLQGQGIPRVEAMLGVVQSSAARLQYLFENMIAAARPDGARGHVRFEPVDVAETLRSVVRVLLPISEGNGVTIAVDLPEHLEVRGDRGGMEQVFTNVVANAVKFSSRGGVVRVGARARNLGENGTVVVTVTDTGIGISESALPRIGSKLFRAPNAKAAAVQGSGLGLFISREILSAAGGDMALTSKLGAGTQVVVTVPAVDRRDS